MTFRLKSKKRVGRSMRRALAHDLRAAAETLRADDVPLERRVHKARRKLKRDRSLVRVFAPIVPELARAIRRDIRDAGREIAALREAHALAAAAADLGRQLDPAGGEALVAAVTIPEEQHDAPAAIARAVGKIDDASALVGYLPVGGGRRLYNDALERSYKDARKMHRKAERSGRTADLHEWRKALKVLVHLTQFGDGQVKRHDKTLRRAREAEELLGDDHDLAILRGRLMRGGRSAASRFVRNVEIGKRRAALQRKAFKLGRAIDKAKPPVLR